jgi:hypothetical protein
LQQRVDMEKRQALLDAGITVVVFTEDTTSWPAVLADYSWLFGEGKGNGLSESAGSASPRPDPSPNGPAKDTGSAESLGDALDDVFREHHRLFGQEGN